MKKKDLIVILAVLVAAVALLLYGYSMRSTPAGQNGLPSGTEEPLPSEESGREGEKAENNSSGYSEKVREAAGAFLEEYPAESYLLRAANPISSKAARIETPFGSPCFRAFA